MSITPSSTPQIKTERPRVQTFRALRHRNFLLLWVSLIVSSVGTWLQIVSQSLLVLQITHYSPVALGLVSLAQAASFFIFAFIGGSIADQSDKRRFLLITQTLSMLLAAILGVLTITGVIQVWMIIILAFLSGTVLSFDQPARSSLVPILVPKEDLMNAVSLQSIVFNGAAFVGPALAGVFLQLFTSLEGPFGFAKGSLFPYAGNFFLNALSFLGVLAVLYLLRLPADAEESMAKRGPLLASIKASLVTIKRDEALPWVLSGYGALLFFGPSNTLILPIFGAQILHINPVQLGLLFSAAGLGTIIGALTVASLGDFRSKGLLLLCSLFIWTASLLIFAVSHSFLLSLFSLFIFGISQNGVGATTITLLQTRVPPQMRGRVMSLNTLLIMGVRPLGDFPASGLIALVGGPLTVLICSSIVGLYSLFLFVMKPVLRKL
ncbi:MFS transporter [Tengunoibacter tsumagoiensis]|uniref:MFS transporter n=1 Tax=Tengunoibacter tsumagoiensis TaxID=2014871 RepID=A0A401ZZ46_9CHLR|nr:MFS transporter [Tengunoibacter tsumagoiensis]GCE12092.1 MFS transporter [Tengunoibacter tsumagoiensis]